MSEEQEICGFCGEVAEGCSDVADLSYRAAICNECMQKIRDGKELVDSDGVTWRTQKVTSIVYVATKKED